MPWGVVYYRTADNRVPADEFLDRCPDKVEATILAVLEAVRRAPPPAFSGGGKWEAMHGTMGGYYEIRVTGPQIVVINGMDKPVGQLFSDADYRRQVRRLGDDYCATLPRPIAQE
jgi:Txe/YoeB family toxin of Txe-Axe toxin-antitoxin module